MTVFEAVGRGSIPRRGTNGPWSVVDARDSAKVVDQVRLLAGTFGLRVDGGELRARKRRNLLYLTLDP